MVRGPDKREVRGSTPRWPTHDVKSCPVGASCAGGALLFRPLFWRGVHSWCPFLRRHARGRQTAAVRERGAQRDAVGPLVALENRLGGLPPAQVREIAERRVLEFRCELPPQTVPSAPRLRFDAREFFQAIPPRARAVSRHRVRWPPRRWEYPAIPETPPLTSCMLKPFYGGGRQRCVELTRFRGRLTRPSFGVEVVHEDEQDGRAGRAA